jgi:hypothetical protein
MNNSLNAMRDSPGETRNSPDDARDHPVRITCTTQGLHEANPGLEPRAAESDHAVDARTERAQEPTRQSRRPSTHHGPMCRPHDP